MMGLCGIGDMMLSCSSPRSRNFAMGQRLGQVSDGEVAGQLSTRTGGLAEGVASAEPVAHMARKLGVTMPIVFAVADIMNGSIGIDAAITKLLERPSGREGV
jgi:glycerol-3-phosphate dehydrogenase (NAD(P)+)